MSPLAIALIGVLIGFTGVLIAAGWAVLYILKELFK